MNTSEPANTESATGKPTRGWVWHSTDASITAGQISVLSVLETLCALGLYIWLAFYFEHQWWLLISAVAAPLLLLRSPNSTETALLLLQHYWENNEGSILDHSKKRQHIDKKEKIFIRIILLLTALLMLYALAIDIGTLIHQQPKPTISHIIFMALFYIVLMMPTFLLLFSQPFILLDTKVFDLYLFTSIYFSFIVIAGFNNILIGTTIITISYSLSTINYHLPLGIFIRSFFIRIKSIMTHLDKGFPNLPRNWLEISFSIDSTVFPELIPRAKEISIELDLTYLFKQVVSKKPRRTFNSLMHFVIWYPPTLLWRWSLKATLWLWWPLALLLRPDKNTDNIGKIRKAAVTQIWVSGWLLWVAIITAFWLATGHFSMETVQSLAELTGANTGKWLEKLLALATPPKGLLAIALWLCCGIVGLTWLYSQYVQKQSPKTLAEEDAIYEMHEEPKQMFITHSRWLARLYTFLVVSFILLGYTVVLHLAKLHYPMEVARFFPNWLINYL